LGPDATEATKAITLALLAIAGLGFCAAWLRSLAAHGREGLEGAAPSTTEVLVGLCTDFLDTLGIGSFATTTTLYKLLRGRIGVPDQAIPGTLNVGHALPTVAQALIFIAIVRVDPVTLASMIGGAVAGAWVGSGVVARWPVRPIRLGLGGSLFVAAGVMLAAQLHALPAGGEALGLRGMRLASGVLANAALGALMTLGVGLYGPCMVLVSILGMNPIAAFPIMMGSCAFLMPIASARFIARRAYVPSAAAGLTVGGTPAVLVAAWLVRSLPLVTLRWMVIGVVTYAALQMLSAAASSAPAGDGPSVAPHKR
jgi:uncharacterized membrane protein YfcA